MKLITLVEDTTNSSLIPVHGLSFYIETKRHRILFDLGPDDTLFENAKKKNIDLATIDSVIISHGHYDHGGGLKKFLSINNIAKVYIQESAFGDYYSKGLLFKKYAGLDKTLKNNPNVVLLNGDITIDDELSIFVVKTEDRFKSEANSTLYNGEVLDTFKHEQNLIINENKKALIMGCGHSGLINILENMNGKPDYCIGGFHIYNPTKKITVSDKQLKCLSSDLNKYDDVKFYTCHCTGKQAYEYLSVKHNNIKYLACGDELTI